MNLTPDSSRSAQPGPTANANGPMPWVSAQPIETWDVLERMITDDLKRHRVTAGYERRLIKFATEIGLSRVQATHLVARCRRQLLQTPATPTTIDQQCGPRTAARAWPVWVVILLAAVATLLSTFASRWVR